MKESTWKDRLKKHRVTMENIHPAKTTQIRGLMGVTFSSNHFTWSHNFSSVAGFLTFSKATFSH